MPARDKAWQSSRALSSSLCPQAGPHGLGMQQREAHSQVSCGGCTRGGWLRAHSATAGSWEREELRWSGSPLRSQFPVPFPAHSLAQGRKRLSTNGGEAPQRPGSLHFFSFAFSRQPWGIPSCQFLFSAYPGCDPLLPAPQGSVLLALCPTHLGRAGGRMNRHVAPQPESRPRLIASPCCTAITQGLAAPCWKEGKGRIWFHSEAVTAEIPAIAEKTG